MIYENIELSGSLDVSGSFIVPNGPSSSTPSNPDTGSLFFNTTDSTLYEWVGSWSIVGTQVQPPPPGADVEYLVVAGGGGGGADSGGGPGGGAGGYLSSSLSSIESGSTFTVTVGAGGTAMASNVPAGDGGDSSIAGDSISTVTSIGGGGAGSFYETPDSLDYYGHDGGSGGGSGNGNGSYTRPSGGSGTVGQGNDGGGAYPAGVNNNNNSGGGGGGAGTAGTSGTSGVGGNGGDGLQSSITGTSTYYAGGGGATCRGDLTEGTGGLGGGGDGGYLYGQNGTANTGGGAGGSRSTPAAVGGSGVVILAYDSGSMNGAGGIVGDAGNGRKYHQFNSSGTYKTGNTGSFQVHTANLVMHIDAGNFDSRGTSTTGYDLTSYGNDINLSGQSGGSLTNNPWWNCDGTGGLADFDRNGVSAASGVAHTGYGSFTGRTNVGWCIDFWIKSTATGGWASGGKTIIGRNSSDIYANITIYNNKANWNHYDGSWQNESSTTSINDGSWHHCTFNNHSDETIDIWVDGTKENDGASSAVNPDSRYFKMDSIGRGYSGENTAMDIGQIRVYDATLTDAQILQNYNATKTNFV